MIHINNLFSEVKKGDFFNRKIEILHDVNLHIPSGKIFAIIGANGAGKSTLLKNILGFITPSSGSIKFAQDKTIGFLPENPYYYDCLTLKELLWFSARTFGIGHSVFLEKLPEITNKVGMTEHVDKRLRGFSKGMTQRAGIAAAIIHDPDIVIFDEPMSGLDPLGRKMVFDLIMELKNCGKTVLFCSHILSDVERLCDSVAIMDHGKVRRVLNKDELLLAQKETEVVLPANDHVTAILKKNTYRNKKIDEYISVFLNADEVNRALNLFSANLIEIVTIKSSAETLENIFYQIVNPGN